MLFFGQHGYPRDCSRSSWPWPDPARYPGTAMTWTLILDDLAELFDSARPRRSHESIWAVPRAAARFAAISRTSRRQACREGGPDWRRAATHAEDGEESRRLADFSVRWDPGRRRRRSPSQFSHKDLTLPFYGYDNRPGAAKISEGVRANTGKGYRACWVE